MSEGKKISIYDLEGNFLQEFDSLTKLCRDLSLTEDKVLKCLRGQSNYHKYFQFRRHRISNIGEVYSVFNSGKTNIPVAKLWNGKVIAVYNSFSECEFKNGINKGNISLIVDTGKTHAGFEFKTIN